MPCIVKKFNCVELIPCFVFIKNQYIAAHISTSPLQPSIIYNRQLFDTLQNK